MSVTPIPHPPAAPDPADRSLLRGAALGDAARLAGAADLLLVHARAPRHLALAEGLVAGEHWRGPLALDVATEPLMRAALAGISPIRSVAGQRHRVVGPYWTTDAVLVPHHDQRGSTIVILAGFAQPPTDDTARYAAAAVRALFPIDDARRRPPLAQRATSHRDRVTGLLDRDGWEATLRRREARAEGAHAVLLIDAGCERDAIGHLDERAILRRAAAAVRANARRADLIARVGAGEIAVLMRGIEIAGCLAIAMRVRTLLEHDPLGPPVSIGWAAARDAGAIARALEVARAMVAQDRRARAAQREA